MVPAIAIAAPFVAGAAIYKDIIAYQENANPALAESLAEGRATFYGTVTGGLVLGSAGILVKAGPAIGAMANTASMQGYMAASGALSAGAAKMSQVTTPVINSLLANPSQTSNLLNQGIEFIDGFKDLTGSPPTTPLGFLGSFLNQQNLNNFMSTMNQTLDTIETLGQNSETKEENGK